jgi:hypothetical protein
VVAADLDTDAASVADEVRMAGGTAHAVHVDVSDEKLVDAMAA